MTPSLLSSKGQSLDNGDSICSVRLLIWSIIIINNYHRCLVIILNSQPQYRRSNPTLLSSPYPTSNSTAHATLVMSWYCRPRPDPRYRVNTRRSWCGKNNDTHVVLSYSSFLSTIQKIIVIHPSSRCCNKHTVPPSLPDSTFHWPFSYKFRN